MKLFLQTKFGWITPTGSLIACTMYNHYAALGDRYRARYRELCDHYTEEMHNILYAEQQNSDDYYHPAMHRFDPENDAARDLEKEIYGEGYVRLGCYKSGGKKIVELMCKESSLDKNKEAIDMIYEIGEFDRLIWTNSSSDRWTRAKQKILKDRRNA